MPPYDFDLLYKSILAAVAASGAIGQRMHAVIDECERQLPHADWERLRGIDFDADLPLLETWLAEAWREGAVRTGERGLWFGLFNPVDAQEGATSDMYLASGPSYEGQSLDWPCEIDLRDGVSYLHSAVLAAMYRVAYGGADGLRNNAEYPLALTYAAIAARTTLEQGLLPAGLASLHGAAVGFDDGDALFIGEFDNLRFCPQLRAA